MGRSRPKTKNAETQTDLNDLINSFSADIKSLCSDLAELNSKVFNIQSKIDNEVSEMNWQQKCSENERLEDKEILLGLEDKLEHKLPDSLQKIEAGISSLKATTQQLTRESDALNNLQQGTEVSMELLEDKVQQLEETQQTRTAWLDKYLNEKSDAVNCMQLKIDNIEQQNKKNHLRIVGIPEEDGEDTTNKIIELAREKLKIRTAQVSDFEDVQMLGPRDYKANRDVLVVCANINIKNQLYNRRKFLRVSTEKIFINEDLTIQRSKLFYQARMLRKRSKLFGVWTQNGNIMVKLEESSHPKSVKDYKTLKTLILNKTTELQLSEDEPSISDEDID